MYITYDQPGIPDKEKIIVKCESMAVVDLLERYNGVVDELIEVNELIPINNLPSKLDLGSDFDPGQYIFLERSKQIYNNFVPGKIRKYCFQSSVNGEQYPLSLTTEAFSYDNGNYHVMLKHGSPPTQSDYEEILSAAQTGSIWCSGKYNGIFYNVSSMIARITQVDDGNYGYDYWYVWIYNFGSTYIDQLRIGYVGPVQ